MKKIHGKIMQLLAALMALTLLPLPATAAAGPVVPDAKNGALAVSVRTGGQWAPAGLVYCDECIGHETVNLEGFIAHGQDVTIRVARLSGGASHLDAVLLGGAAPIAVAGGGEAGAGKLAARDNDLIETGADGVVMTFSRPFVYTLLTVCARIESEDITKQPFLFPAGNLGRKMDETALFYTYVLDSSPGSLRIDGDICETDGLSAFFGEYCVTGTGHPPGYTYAWVQNDDEYLYVSMDFTPDNTMDGDKDYAKVYVKTQRGLREFKVSMKENVWGTPGFAYTGKVNYQHKVYEFAIPLSELGVSGGCEAALQLAFAAYGTAAPVTYPATVTVNKDGSEWTEDPPEIMIGYDFASAWPNGSNFLNGTYNIYADGIDTGADITVAGAPATATLDYYTLTLNAGAGIESVSGAGTYVSGSGAGIDAVVAEGYAWETWSDGNTDKSRTVTVNGTLTLTASATLTPTPTPTPTPAPTASPTNAPTQRPKPKPKPKPTATPTLTPTLTAAPSATPSPAPTPSPVPAGSSGLTVTPSPTISPAPPQSPMPGPTGGSGATTGAPNTGGGSGWAWWLLGGIAAAGAASVLAFRLIPRLRRK